MTPISDWLIKSGHTSTILSHSSYDTFGMTESALSSKLADEVKSFYLLLVDEIKKLKPTHIHINSHLVGLVIARSVAPWTPIVFQYHGTDIRGRIGIHKRVKYLSDKVIVSTEDLMQYGEWYGCPIPTQFEYKGGRKPNTALMIISGSAPVDKTEDAIQYCFEHNLELTIVDGRIGERIPSTEMPEYLSRFEYYLDFKGLDPMSKTGMEAIECGCKVVPEYDLSLVINEYKKTTPADYLELYNSLPRPNPMLTALRLLVCLPLSRWYISRAR
ncbi:MAG: hypothetical protein ACTSQZ_09020 [Candidatus Thorarchaeota archaeon]